MAEKLFNTLIQPKNFVSTMTSEKVIQMGLLFALLSPGLLVQLPDNCNNKMSLSWNNMKTSQTSVLMHALILFVVLMQMKMDINKIFLAVMLFVFLSPGFVLELPSPDDQVVNTNRTSYEAILVHTLLFMLLFGVWK